MDNTISIDTTKDNGFIIGGKIKIIDCLYDHGFEIGDIVTITDKGKNDGEWICEGLDGKWWYIQEEEGYPIK